MQGESHDSMSLSEDESAGLGRVPYYPYVGLPSSYDTAVYYDAAKALPYFIAVVVEWFDRRGTFLLLPRALVHLGVLRANLQRQVDVRPTVLKVPKKSC